MPWFHLDTCVSKQKHRIPAITGQGDEPKPRVVYLQMRLAIQSMRVLVLTSHIILFILLNNLLLATRLSLLTFLHRAINENKYCMMRKLIFSIISHFGTFFHNRYLIFGFCINNLWVNNCVRGERNNCWMSD